MCNRFLSTAFCLLTLDLSMTLLLLLLSPHHKYCYAAVLTLLDFWHFTFKWTRDRLITALVGVAWNTIPSNYPTDRL